MIDNPNLEEYKYPDLYDLENPDFEPEGSFYLSIAQSIAGTILELGCGTGRFTIPLAQKGLKITGLDAVPGMLSLARAKAGSLPVQWIEADARSFSLHLRFDLIFESGSTFMHMLTNQDQLAFLANVQKHLAPGGCFAVSLLFPHPGLLQTDLAEKEWFSYPDGKGGTVQVSGTEEYDQLRQVKTETAIRRITRADGQKIVHAAPLQLRYTFPQEMEKLLARNGFEVVERYGGPDRSPLTNGSQFMVYVCKSTGT